MRKGLPMAGVEFEKVDGETRSIYKQGNGETVLADKCTCKINYSSGQDEKYKPMWVTRNPKCPIDEHRTLLA